MLFSRLIAGSVLIATFAAVVGCSARSTEKAEEDVAATEAELKLRGTRYLGKIKNGQTRKGYYSTPPTYRSYGFEATGGDEITVDVTSVYGDGMGWITDARYNVLAFNDDASYSTLDAKVTYKVPAGQPSDSYRIVFRDYDLLEATFNVTLSIRSTEPSTCSYGGQTYQSGEEFEATDGCNTCLCTDGSVACTKIGCTCNPAAEPHRNYVGTPQQCMVIRYTCPTGQVPFSNSCGCGCEPAP